MRKASSESVKREAMAPANDRIGRLVGPSRTCVCKDGTRRPGKHAGEKGSLARKSLSHILWRWNNVEPEPPECQPQGPTQARGRATRSPGYDHRRAGGRAERDGGRRGQAGRRGVVADVAEQPRPAPP